MLLTVCCRSDWHVKEQHLPLLPQQQPRPDALLEPSESSPPPLDTLTGGPAQMAAASVEWYCM